MSSQASTRRNRALVLAAADPHEAVSRAEIVAATGLSMATVSRATAALIDQGLLTEESSVGPAGGRPLGRVRVHPRAASVLAVDIADRHSSVAVVDLSGAVIWQDVVSSVPEGAEARLSHSLQLIAEVCAAHPAVVAVGVSIPGPVQSDGMVPIAPALQWHDVPLGALLAELLSLPVAVGNDANLIAVAESKWGEHREAASLVAVAVFDGVGAGIVDGGKLLEGSGGFAGQVGRMLLGTGAFDRGSLDFGELETHLGAAGLQRRAAAAGVLLPSDEPFAALFAADADVATVALGDQVLDEFAVALGNVCALLDPAVIVLAGRFAPLADTVGPALSSRLEGRVLHVPAIVPTSTLVDGALLGAAVIAFDRFGSLDQLIGR